MSEYAVVAVDSNGEGFIAQVMPGVTVEFNWEGEPLNAWFNPLTWEEMLAATLESVNDNAQRDTIKEMVS